MKTVLVLIIATASLVATVASADTPPARKRQNAPAAAAALTEVKVCPITGTAIKGKGTGSAVVGKYKVYFCCTGCQEAFAKLSPEEKERKVAEAVEKQKQMNKKG